jgi:hypothetical protein
VFTTQEKTLSVHYSGGCTEDHRLHRCPSPVQPVPLCLTTISNISDLVNNAPVLFTQTGTGASSALRFCGPAHPVSLNPFVGPACQSLSPVPFSLSRRPLASPPFHAAGPAPPRVAASTVPPSPAQHRCSTVLRARAAQAAAALTVVPPSLLAAAAAA